MARTQTKRGGDLLEKKVLAGSREGEIKGRSAPTD